MNQEFSVTELKIAAIHSFDVEAFDTQTDRIELNRTTFKFLTLKYFGNKLYIDLVFKST